MIYKLYISKFNKIINRGEYISKASKIYRKHNVIIVGSWTDANNPMITYYITGYKDNEHYEKFVDEMRRDEEYQQMTVSLKNSRENIEVITMVLADNPIVVPDEFSLLEYVRQVRSTYDD